MMQSSGGGIILKYSLTVLMVGTLSVNCSSIYYVTAEGKEHDCPLNETCYDLSYHISHQFNRYHSLQDNTIIRLLPGTHHIPDGQVLYIGFANNLVIEGYNSTIIQGFHETVQQSTVIIQCIGQTGGIFIGSGNNITLRGLTIINCGFVQDLFLFRVLIQIHIHQESISLLLREGYVSVYALFTRNLFIYNISIQNSTQFGLGIQNIEGLLVIESCSFARNSLEISNKFLCFNGICHGGNAIITLYDTSANVNIINSNFSFGISASYGGVPLSGLLVEVTESYANITLDSIVAYGNIGNLGANIALVATATSDCTFTLKNSLSTMANYQYNNSFGTSLGGGFLARISIFDDMTNKIQIINSTFTNNAATYGGGICVLQLQDSPGTSIEVISSIIENNSGIIGIGIAVINAWTVQKPLKKVFIANTTISSSIVNYFVNTFELFNLGSFRFDLELIQLKYLDGVNAASSDGATSHSSAIGLVNAHDVTFKDVSIRDNSVTGIRAFHSRVIFKGIDNVIEGNKGSNGGGLSLIDESLIVLGISTSVSFINNFAIRGGGIFTDEPSSFTNNTCFYAIQSYHNQSFIKFKGNVASEGGSAVYGEDIEHCSFHSDYNSSYSSSDIFNMIFDYSEEYGNSVISSDPFKVCLCENSVANCSQRTHHVSSYPGDNVVLQVVLVGERDGFSTGTLSAQPGNLISPFSTSVPDCQSVIFLTLNINMTSIDIVLSVDNVNGRNTEGVDIILSIEECPIGFELNKTELVCGCHSLINNNIPNTKCNVTDKSITKGSAGWIGFDNSSSCILFDAQCPFDFCITNISNNTITLEDQSQQCSMNRSGILCGQCNGNYSLMLGSNECGECPQHYGYLALLIVFIVAGVALVVLLIVLNLTVSMSTINGLIFFANIVHINENSILISTRHADVLSHFISWINLDFGFKVCFYPGMDSYAKTWLQFVFPFYIWFIIALIIFSTKYSTKISKLVSRNIISVLATLILTSYTKLFRAIIFSFHRSNLIKICDNITTTVVWSVDGNINYFGLKHAPLFIFSLMVLFLLIIPFTLSLLLSPLLESYLSRYKLFKWWVNLKPFIDAYNGPYKDRYRFWTGLLLLAHLVIVLTVSFSGNLHVDRLVTLTVSILLLSFVWIVDGVYTNRYSNTLELFFIVNLITTTVASGYGPDLDDNVIRQVLVYSCVSLSILVFVGIIIYHIWMRCSENEFIKKCYTKVIESRRKEASESNNNNLHLESKRKTSDVDVINRNKSRDDVTHTECSIEMGICKRESMIFDD